MLQTATENSTDYIFASEYNYQGGHHWYTDSNGKAAIVCSSNSTIIDTGHSEQGFRWIAVEGVTLYSCYWSPNSKFPEYLQFLNRLETSVRARNTEIIIAGDFNAWHSMWGSKVNNRRGEALVDLIIALGLVIGLEF